LDGPPGEHLALGGQRLRLAELLDGDPPVDKLVVGQPGGSHAAVAELVQQQVTVRHEAGP
jgi:hypothetical protein